MGQLGFQPPRPRPGLSATCPRKKIEAARRPQAQRTPVTGARSLGRSVCLAYQMAYRNLIRTSHLNDIKCLSAKTDACMGR
jgi:hypothetical protein